jgi:hypothetical protein
MSQSNDVWCIESSRDSRREGEEIWCIHELVFAALCLTTYVSSFSLPNTGSWSEDGGDAFTPLTNHNGGCAIWPARNLLILRPPVTWPLASKPPALS